MVVRAVPAPERALRRLRDERRELGLHEAQLRLRVPVDAAHRAQPGEDVVGQVALSRDGRVVARADDVHPGAGGGVVAGEVGAVGGQAPARRGARGGSGDRAGSWKTFLELSENGSGGRPQPQGALAQPRGAHLGALARGERAELGVGAPAVVARERLDLRGARCPRRAGRLRRAARRRGRRGGGRRRRGTGGAPSPRARRGRTRARRPSSRSRSATASANGRGWLATSR